MALVVKAAEVRLRSAKEPRPACSGTSENRVSRRVGKDRAGGSDGADSAAPECLRWKATPRGMWKLRRAPELWMQLEVFWARGMQRNKAQNRNTTPVFTVPACAGRTGVHAKAEPSPTPWTTPPHASLPLSHIDVQRALPCSIAQHSCQIRFPLRIEFCVFSGLCVFC